MSAIYFPLPVTGETLATKAEPERRREGPKARSFKGHTIHQGRVVPQSNPPPTRHACSLAAPYLLVGVRSVEAQEKVRSLSVEQEVSCPEWDGKAMDGIAEVECDPEVLNVSICKDVLRREQRSSQQVPAGPPDTS